MRMVTKFKLLDLLSHSCTIWPCKLTNTAYNTLRTLLLGLDTKSNSLCLHWLGLATVSCGFWSESWTISVAEKVQTRASYPWYRSAFHNWWRKRGILGTAKESRQIHVHVHLANTSRRPFSWNCSPFELLLSRHSHSLVGKVVRQSCHVTTSINCKWPTWPCETRTSYNSGKESFLAKTFRVQLRLGSHTS